MGPSGTSRSVIVCGRRPTALKGESANECAPRCPSQRPRLRQGGTSTLPRRVISKVALGAIVASMLVLGLVQRVDAVPIQPFASRFTANDNGAITLFGNNLMTCSGVSARPAACANTRNRIGSNLNNNTYFMVNVDDGRLDIPHHLQLVELGGDAAVGCDGLVGGSLLGRPARERYRHRCRRHADGGRNQMLLRAPGDASYRTITTQDTFGPSTTADRTYQQFANVTAIVQATGPGTYWGANVPAATGEDRYAGWSLVVVYREPTLPLRNLTVFDGFSDVGRDDPETVTISGSPLRSRAMSTRSSASSPGKATPAPGRQRQARRHHARDERVARQQPLQQCRREGRPGGHHA